VCILYDSISIKFRFIYGVLNIVAFRKGPGDYPGRDNIVGDGNVLNFDLGLD
jgi:hypothetical protein